MLADARPVEVEKRGFREGIFPDYSASSGQKKLRISVKYCFGQVDSTVVDELHIKVKIGILQSLDDHL